MSKYFWHRYNRVGWEIDCHSGRFLCFWAHWHIGGKELKPHFRIRTISIILGNKEYDFFKGYSI